MNQIREEPSDNEIEDCYLLLDGPGNLESIMRIIIHEACEVPLLSKLGEMVLLIRMAVGDEIAAKRIYRSNLRLALHFAFRTLRRGGSFSDAYQDMCLAISKASEYFDISIPGHDRQIIKFATYAWQWMGKYVQKSISQGKYGTPIPYSSISFTNRVNRIADQLRQEGVDATPEAIAERINHGLPSNPVGLLQKIQVALESETPLSFNSPYDESDTDRDDLIDKTPDPSADVEDRTHDNLRRQAISEVVDALNLSERDRYCLLATFGLIPGKEGINYTSTEIGNEIGLTNKRVRQIVGGILARIRRCWKYRKILEGFY